MILIKLIYRYDDMYRSFYQTIQLMSKTLHGSDKVVLHNNNETMQITQLVIGPIIDRDQRSIANYAIELNQPLVIETPANSDHQTINFKELKNILIEKKIRMVGIKPIDQYPMTDEQLLNDIDHIDMELKKARDYADQNNCQTTMDILMNSPYKLFRMKDQNSFELYLSDIEKIFDKMEKNKMEIVERKINEFVF